MSISVGAYVLSDGSRYQPARITAASGSRAVRQAHPIRSDKKVYDRKGRAFDETVEVSYTYTSSELARAGWISRRAAALAEPKGAYVDGSATVGNALIDSVNLVWSDGCGITVAYHITGELA